MVYSADILLGKITKVYGYEGAVSLRLEKAFIENIPAMESVFLEIEGKAVPFFISALDYPGADILRLTFNGYESVNMISGFVGCRVFLTGEVQGVREYLPDYMALTGFKVMKPDKTCVGIIKRIIENPGQLISVIEAEDGTEILIPLHEDLIVEADPDTRILLMDLPEGLTDINQ